jgi:ATP-dependent Clp protease ATP-binding subunit ClpB
VDFRNTVIIMTSNIGSEYITATEDYDEMKKQVTEALRRTFKPEFLNRIDEIITYHPLSREVMKKIVDIQIQRLSAMLHEKNLDLRLTEAAREHLATAGFDPVYGARSLKRLIQNEVFDPLAEKILEGQMTGGDTINVDYRDGAMVFTVERGRDEEKPPLTAT